MQIEKLIIKYDLSYTNNPKEATKPAGQNILQQQEKFDKFMQEYNHERPYEALEMQTPAEVYLSSQRMHERTITVTNCGRICINRRKINFSRAFAGHPVGVRQVDDRIWLVSFMSYDLGYFDEEADRVEPGQNPFAVKL